MSSLFFMIYSHPTVDPQAIHVPNGIFIFSTVLRPASFVSTEDFPNWLGDILLTSVFIWDFRFPGELKLLLSLSLSELGRSGNQGSHGDLAKPPADDQLNWCFSLPHTDSAHHQL